MAKHLKIFSKLGVYAELLTLVHFCTVYKVHSCLLKATIKGVLSLTEIHLESQAETDSCISRQERRKNIYL